MTTLVGIAKGMESEWRCIIRYLTPLIAQKASVKSDDLSNHNMHHSRAPPDQSVHC